MDARRKGIESKPNVPKVIYRYCSVPECIAAINNNTWTFASPTTWPDRCEHFVHDAVQKSLSNELRSDIFGKCFSTAHSSAAMWRLFSSSSGTVRMRIKTEALLGHLRRRDSEFVVYAFHLRYLSRKDLEEAVNDASSAARGGHSEGDTAALALLKLKHIAYAHEAEYRVLVLKPRTRIRWRQSHNDAHTETVSINSSGLVDEVLVDPFLPEWQGRGLVDLLLTCLPSEISVARSQLTDPPSRRRPRR